MPEAIALRATVAVRDSFYREFADFAVGISADKPILFALDTFEIVQHYGSDTVHEVWEFLDDLQRRLPSLRVVIAGRAPMDRGYFTQPVPLRGFDEASAQAFLTSLLGPELAADAELVSHIISSVGRNPLSLRLAADLVVNHGAQELDDISNRRLLLLRVRTEQIQGWLYQRILNRITDPDVRALAHPGLIVRRLTPDVIRYVLAHPCNVNVPSDLRARELFDACSREISLLSWNTDGSLQHRADLRREMLPLLRQAEPQKAAEIHSAAVSYYQRYDDITSRAEELYHRLCLGETGSSLDARWQRGVEDFLIGALEEVPAEGQVYLAAHLGITLPHNILDKARLREQERYTATRVRQLIRFGELDTALDVLRNQQKRTHNSPLDLLEAQVLEELGRLDEASKVLDQASQRAAEAADDNSFAQLQYAAARLAQREGRTDTALDLLVAAQTAMPEAADPLMRLRILIARLRLRRLAFENDGGEVGLPDQQDIAAVRARVLSLVDTLPAEQVSEDPALLAELVSEIGEERPHLVTRALLIIGLHDLTPSQIRGLAAALASWDAQSGHQPAHRLRLTKGPDIDVPAWEKWLRSTPLTTATRGLVGVMNRYPGHERVIAVLTSIYRESLAQASAGKS